MKSLQEFTFLTKNANVFYAVYYLFYKLSLKIYNLPVGKSYRRKKTVWITKIYDYLSLLNNQQEVIDGKKLIAFCDIEDNSKKIYLRPFSSDLQVYSQVITQQSYQPVIEIYKQVFKESPISLIDLGANIGLASIFFSGTFKGLNILAVEPFRDNYDMAELNMRSNKIENYKLLLGGVWDKNTKLSIKRDFRDGKEWGINLVEDVNGDIEGFCFEELLRNYHQIDILKIDIEGAEKNIFEKNGYASGVLRKIKCIAIEIHDEFNCRPAICSILKNNNFLFYDIQDMTIAINRNFM